MRKIIKIQYRSIFKYPEHQEVIKYDETGYFSEVDDKTIIEFKGDSSIKLELHEEMIRLFNGTNVLKLVKDQDVINHYDSGYGLIELKTRLISFDLGDSIKIRYELYDGMHLLSKVYIMVNFQVLEN